MLTKKKTEDEDKEAGLMFQAPIEKSVPYQRKPIFLQKYVLSLLLFIIEVMLELENAYMYTFFEYEWVTYIKLHTCIIVQHNCSFHFRQMACLLRDVIACQLGINLLRVTSCSTLSLSSEAILTLSSVEETVWLAWESNNAVYECSCIWTRKRRLNA